MGNSRQRVPSAPGAKGVAVPKATPEAIRKTLSDEFAKVNKDPAYRQKMKDGGFVVIDVPYEKMDEFMSAKAKEYEAAARDVGMLKK